MSDELLPVDESEFVYRRIPAVFHDAALPIPIQYPAFRPNPKDATGLSVFRAKFVAPADTLDNVDPDKRDHYYVARLAIRDVRALGLERCA